MPRPPPGASRRPPPFRGRKGWNHMTRHIDNIIEAKGALILGAGVAGLFTAIKLAPFPSLVLAGTRPGVSGSSAWAQGGIAAAMDANDSWQAHAADTLAAGAGLCDAEVAAFVAREAPARIRDLIALGAPFDIKPDGTLALGREAAHSAHRIVHVKGDRAGAEVTRILAERALETPSITLLEGYHAIELAVEDGRVVGLFARTGVGRACAPCAVPRTGGDFRDRRRRRALRRHHQSAGSARRRPRNGGARGRRDRRCGIRAISSHRDCDWPRSRAARDRSLARRRRDPDRRNRPSFHASYSCRCGTGAARCRGARHPSRNREGA